MRVGDDLGQQLRAAVEGATKALLLSSDPAENRVVLGIELWVDVVHGLDRPLRKPLHVGGPKPESTTVLNRAAHDPPQDVAAVLV